MSSFNALKSNLNIHKNYLIEASAGTGKTFSIENIVSRLLIEPSPNTLECLTIDKILVVTFTRAAARDLKIRIRTQIEKSIAILKASVSNTTSEYLQTIIQQGEESIRLAKKNLEQALATFEQAHIYTIHSFCMRMLTQFVFESDFNMTRGLPQEKILKKEEIRALIRDFFRTEISSNIYSAAQLKIILQEHNQCIEDVQEALLKHLNADYEIALTSSYQSDFERFCATMHELKAKHMFNPLHLSEDLERQSPFYKSLKNKNLSSIESFFKMFDKDHWTPEDFDFLIQEGLLICEFLHARNVNKKKIKQLPDQNTLHYPQLIDLLSQSLDPLIQQARSYACIFARMAYHCKQLLHKYIEEEEKYRESDLLKFMLRAMGNPLFVCKVQNLYGAAIIDEFQDTDPMQWQIFQRLFLNNPRCILYLVGDPKQSIYAFRQADIYTYLSAAQSIGSENHASLETNFRSQPSLVAGLNQLFQACPQLFSLPSLSTESFLPYPSVKYAPQAKDKIFSDHKKSIHFFQAEVVGRGNQAEEDFFFPFIVQEILNLHQADQVQLNQFAILIKDKFQGQRLAEFLDRYQIPYNLQRQSSLTESIAWDSLKELLRAVIHPRNESFVKIALGGPIMGWNYKEVKNLSDPLLMVSTLTKFHHLKDKLLQEGVGCFFDYVMHTIWDHKQESIREKLLKMKGGDVFLDELYQIIHLLMEYQIEHPCSPEKLLLILDEYKKLSVEDEERLKKFTDPTRNAVAILTTHNSKGLEYDIVFAYGLIGRPKTIDPLIPVKHEFSQILTPCLNVDEVNYVNYCQELDAEKMRQLYVALTRAKYRLYIPVVIYTKPKAIEYGSASPMDLFLARLGQPPCNYQELYQRIENENGSSLKKIIENSNFFSWQLLNPPFALTNFKMNSSPPLIQPDNIDTSFQRVVIQSFTSLSKSKKAIQENTFSEVPHGFDSSIKNAHTLPSNHITGKILHKILETIPFNQISRAETLIPWIRPLIQNTSFNDWEEVLCEMIYQALQTKLPNGLLLSQLDSSVMYRESEFIYPLEKEIALEGFQWHAGFLKGVIDLIFYHQGFYYLLDWKSNWLGPHEDHYTLETMSCCMQQHHYYFQAEIYREALKRYLKLVDPRPFDTIYGGCYYIFLRGLNRFSEKSRGIVHV